MSKTETEAPLQCCLLPLQWPSISASKNSPAMSPPCPGGMKPLYLVSIFDVSFIAFNQKVSCYLSFEAQPPSFVESQFYVILRRQRYRLNHKNALKFTNRPSRFHTLSNDFEFAGWGSVQYLELSEDNIR